MMLTAHLTLYLLAHRDACPSLFAAFLPLFLATSLSKTPFNLTLSGITNDDVDLSVDALKAVTLPLLKHFGVAEEGGLELKVRFARPLHP